MSLYGQFKSDANVEVTGVVIEYGYLRDDKGQPDLSKPISFRIARAGGANVRFQKRMDAKVKPYRRQIQTETIDLTVLKRLIREVYAETVVLGWDNVTDAAGNVLPFTYDNCLKVFTDLPDLFEDIQEQAARAALFRADIQEVEAGN